MRLKEIEERCAQTGKTIESFHEWMSGQTVGVYPDGELNYYEWDVERFFKGLGVID